MKTKISFPKGSLKFVKIGVPIATAAQVLNVRYEGDGEETPLDFKDYYKRKKFAKLMEKNYPHEAKNNLPGEF